MCALRGAMQHRTALQLVTTLRMLPGAQPKQNLTTWRSNPRPYGLQPDASALDDSANLSCCLGG